MGACFWANNYWAVGHCAGLGNRAGSTCTCSD